MAILWWFSVVGNYQSVLAHPYWNPLTFLPDLPSARQEHGVAAAGDDVYVIGGLSSNYSYTPTTLDVPASLINLDIVQSYNVYTEQWSDRAALPFAVNHVNVASVDGKVYVLGTLLGLNFTLWGAVPNSYVYDPAANTWTALADMPPGTARGACAVGVRGTEVYLAGGLFSLGVGLDAYQDTVAVVSSYDTATDTWNTDFPPLPEPRDHVGGAVVGDKFYVTGGRDHGNLNVRGNTWALDLNDPKSGWKSLANMPTSRGGLSAAAVCDCIYTFGGEGNPNSSDGVFNNVEVYDTRTDTWQELPPLWHGIHGTGAATINDTIYIPGGGLKIGAGCSNFSLAYHTHRRCCSNGGWESF